MAQKTYIEEFLEEEQNLKDFQQEGIILDFLELICEIMEKEKITINQLSKKMEEKNQYYVKRLLRGEENITLRKASDIMTALGYEIKMEAIRI